MTGKVSFDEVGSIKVSDLVTIVVAKVKVDEETTGLNINRYIRTDKYGGYTKGTFIPIDKVAEFQNIISQVVM